MGNILHRWSSGSLNDFGPFFVRGQGTTSGTMLISYHSGTLKSAGPFVDISTRGYQSATPLSMYLLPMFPSSNLPSRYEVNFTFFDTPLAPEVYIIHGSENSGSGFCGAGYNFQGDKFVFFNSGTLERIISIPYDFGGTTFSTGSTNHYKITYESKTNTPTTSSDVSFRTRRQAGSSQSNSTFDGEFMFRMTGTFTNQWASSSINKIYLGFYSTAGGMTGFTGTFICLNKLFIRKHPLDIE